MAVTVSVTITQDLQGGGRLVAGTGTMDADYDATSGGVAMDLSAYFDGSPVVDCGAGLGGYVMRHNLGTATAGLVQCFEAGADGAPLDEIADSTDLSNVTFGFTAVGTVA